MLQKRLILILLSTLYFAPCRSEDDTCTGNDSCAAPEADLDHEESEIDEYLNTLDQDDPVLIDAIKNYYLDQPHQDFEYNIPRDRLTNQKLAGQFGQAAYVMGAIYNYTKTNGFFFEAGAYDGVVISNTLLMEYHFNWTGLLVEANPDNYEKLLEAHRKSFSVGQCLSSKSRPEVVEFDAAGIFGGIIRKGAAKPGDNIPSTDRERMIEIVKKTRRIIRMQCFPLYSLLLAVGNPVVDYMSLDIEGTELAVLRSLPWDKVDIRVISLEIVRKKLNENLPNEHHDPYPEIIELLESKGYKEIHSIAHTPEEITFESIFVKQGVKLI